MIRYALACEKAHEFESWFPSGAAYDEQTARGLVRCPLCDSTRIEKRLMAPAIARTDKPQVTAPAPVPATTEAPPPQALALISERERRMRAFLRALREQVTANAEDVGKGFAEEARKIHYGEAEHRSIYGEASLEEAQGLIEEGIEVHALPVVPDERN